MYPKFSCKSKNIVKIFLFLNFILFLNIIIPITTTSAFPDTTNSTSIESRGLSVILMIGDGMGSEQVKLAQWVEMGEKNLLNMQTLPIRANVSTYNTVNQVTDSAAAATALATGTKAFNSILSVTPSGIPIPTILEYAKELKKSTGIVTTTQVHHATPAAFYSHVKARDDTYNIINQLAGDADVDVLLGGGKGQFFVTQLSAIEEKGYSLIENRSQLATINSGKILGLFSPGGLPYEKDRDRNIVPSISEMTDKALEILSQDPDGFFLMVEGGQIDWACHVNNKENAALEAIEFDKAIEVAINYTQKNENTILIVTADHETGDLTVISNTLNDTLPSKLNSEDQNEQLRLKRVSNVSVSWASGGHTEKNVPFYGLGTALLPYNNTTIDNTDIFNICKNHFDSGDGLAPIIIDHPLIQIYDTSDIWLNITFNETTSWIAYSLNNQPNITIQTYSTLLSLQEGLHHIQVYANDSSGKIGYSEVWFKITFPKISSTTTSSTNTSSQTGPPSNK
ncbi:MAG: alkaline phosphatase [Candidatus Hodarchaeales archaeon]|jgi:alkaline phosphatase